MDQDKGLASILIVDDDRDIRTLLATFLQSHGFAVTTARDGVEMQRQLEQRPHNLAILDLMLPGQDGLDLCRVLRQRSSMPVIMLTARADETDRIVGLEIGADDYVTKPFNPRELLARIRAVLRRTGAGPVVAGGTAPTRNYRFDGWTLSLDRRELTDPAGVMVDLSTGEFDLLLAFLEAPNRVLTREQLLEAARSQPDAVFDRAIDVQVSRLRKKIEPDETSHPMIRTVRGAGYLFVPKVTRA
ncbi:response regulator transcription factor [Rhabdaerophilum sp. SD176]|uniref:response regulator n=1 Tax=Rhabdaerophilum sp. SD176 TaxID=2983548 RepID=UPI0024DFF665|nr:response regulator transcription factor [Rhabdaerophilum sp. SD176]